MKHKARIARLAGLLMLLLGTAQAQAPITEYIPLPPAGFAQFDTYPDFQVRFGLVVSARYDGAGQFSVHGWKQDNARTPDAASARGIALQTYQQTGRQWLGMITTEQADQYLGTGTLMLVMTMNGTSQGLVNMLRLPNGALLVSTTLSDEGVIETRSGALPPEWEAQFRRVLILGRKDTAASSVSGQPQ